MGFYQVRQWPNPRRASPFGLCPLRTARVRHWGGYGQSPPLRQLLPTPPVHNQNNSINNVNAEVTVYTPDFEKLSAYSAGQIFINDDFQLNKLKINLDSAGKVTGNIFAEKLFVNISSAAFLESKVQSKIIEIDASSASKVNLSGSTDEIKINANSVAKINLENLKYKNIQQESSSLAKIYVK